MNASPPLGILLVTHYYAEHRGGVEIVAGELAARLARRGINIVWAASEPAPPANAPGVSTMPMRTWNITERALGFPYPLWGPMSLWRLFRAVRRADVVHLHDSLYLGNFLAYLVARLFGRPVVVTQHIGMVPYSSPVLRGLLTMANHTLGRAVLGGSAQAVFIADKVRNYFSRFVRFRRPPLYIPNGLAREIFSPVAQEQRTRLRAELGLPPEAPILLFVGRFVEKKGLTLLRPLAARLAQYHWIFVGWGPDDPARWNLPNVQAAGGLSHRELADYYRAADLLVLPSSGEGFPLVVQEAMACGTPAVITPDTALGAPGVEQAALVCEPDVDRLAAMLDEVLSRPEELIARREAAAKYAQEHWDWDQCAACYEAIFRELVAERP